MVAHTAIVLPHDTLVLGVWCSTVGFGICLGSFCALVAKSSLSTAGRLRYFVRAGGVSWVSRVSSSTHGFMNSFVCSHASSTASNVDSIISDRRLNVTDSSKSLVVCSRSSHRPYRQCICLHWESCSFPSFAIPLGSPLADVLARCLMRSADSKHGWIDFWNAPSMSVMF